MTTRYYSTRSNAAAGARTALKRPKGKVGADFALHEHDENGKKVFSWSTLGHGAKPKVAKKAAGPKTKRGGGLLEQPQVKKLIALMERPSGVSVAEGAKALHNVEHGVRAMVSQIAKLASVTKTREGRLVRYHKKAA